MLNPADGISVRYIYSACVVTTTPNIKVLNDPWFSEGIYDGSWFHFPKVNDPLQSIGDCDIIYISHIHPDHYDAEFIKSYFSHYGVKRVIIADHSPNHLAGKMRADGIESTVVSTPLKIGRTTIEVVPHKTGSASDIDSAIVIKYVDSSNKTHCVVNVNDIIFDEEMKAKVKAAAGEIDILLCGYTGAGPFPQTYFDINDPELSKHAELKKREFFRRYNDITKFMGAKKNIPFAGKYLLGGKLASLNRYRGVADPVEVMEFDPSAVILADNGGGINTLEFTPTSTRRNPYRKDDIESRVREIEGREMSYERLLNSNEISQLPLKRLLVSAARNAIKKSECEDDYFFCVSIPGEEVAVLNANRNTEKNISFLKKKSELPTPRSEIYIDPRYLFGLLTHVYHWNNAEVGSQYETRRFPNMLNRRAQAFLNYLAI
jgi:UDP-MurNAc hydroxylase